MKLTPAAEFAVRGVLVLAEHGGEKPVTLEAICTRRELPKQYLVKIFSSLNKAGIITPVRGKRGGYLLARDPADITVLDVIEAVEGPIALNLCQHDPPKCQEYHCPLRPVWADLQHYIRSKLGAMTLADCVNGARAPGGS